MFITSSSQNANAAPISTSAARKSAAQTDANATDSFDSSAKDLPLVNITYLPQDPGILPTQTVKVQADESLGNARFQVSDEGGKFTAPSPDSQGNLKFDLDDPRFDDANAFAVANQTLTLAEKYADREIDWSFKDRLGRNQLLIHPHAGKDANAFYDASTGSVNLFYYNNEKTGAIERTAQQHDVVSHETGHAIFDAIRPDYNQSLSVPAGGLHESFGDMMAMLTSLNEPSVVDKLKAETSGDLSKPNVVSSLAEQLGSSFKDSDKPWLRQADNNLKYADQAFLPFVDKETAFGTEPHAYSNLFTGTFYDVFKGLYDQANQAPKSDFTSSVNQARDTAGRLLLRAADFAPVGDISCKEFAQSFLQADMIDNDGKNLAMLKKVFSDRGILPTDQADAFVKEHSQAPDVKLTKAAVENDKSAEAFVDANREALGLPKSEDFDFQKSFKTNKGETFVLFDNSKAAVLNDPTLGRYQGSRISESGGLMLAFDKRGKLEAWNYDQTTDRELEDVIANFKTDLRRNETAGTNMDIITEVGPNGPTLRHSPVIKG